MEISVNIVVPTLSIDLNVILSIVFCLHSLCAFHILVCVLSFLVPCLLYGFVREINALSCVVGLKSFGQKIFDRQLQIFGSKVSVKSVKDFQSFTLISHIACVEK